MSTSVICRAGCRACVVTGHVVMERIAVLQLCLLLLAVPAQYLLGRYMATSPQHRSLAFKRYDYHAITA